MKKIVVIAREDWSDISERINDTEVWTITNDALRKLCGQHEDVDEPLHIKRLGKSDIIEVQGLYDYVDTACGTYDALVKFMKPEKESVK